MINLLISSGVKIIPTAFSSLSYIVWAACLTITIFLIIKLFTSANTSYALIVLLMGFSALCMFVSEETGQDGSTISTLDAVEEYYGVTLDSEVVSLPSDGDSNEVRIIVKQDDKLTIVAGELMREGNQITLYKSDYDLQDTASEWRPQLAE